MASEGEPRSVRDILVEMKDASEFALSLAYASLMYQDRELAEEVLGLESELDELRYNLFKMTIVAGRSPKEAEELAALLDIGIAVDEISDAMADLVRLVLKGYPVHPALSWMLYTAEEIIGLVRIEETSPLISMRGEDLYDPANMAGCEVLAVKKKGRWIFDVPPDLELEVGDLLLLEGTKDSIETARALARGENSKPVVPERPLEKVDEASKEIAERLNSMKSLSELAIYLAYASILYNNPAMASEVSRLEDELDELEDELFAKVIKDLLPSSRPEEIVPLIRAASASERLGDAASRMALIVERGVPAHPVLEIVVEESEDTVVRVALREDSEAVGWRIEDLDLEEKTGMWILAIKRGVRWIYAPKDEEILREGDILILTGPKEGVEDAIKVLGGELLED
ncbi:MAG: TrkA C-terminal domain-containing protein [Candidatus Korarchaeota archaeon]|nr:TrkA C-terminal domain-containing protein [Candidatus Korarchaeota archaeon]